MITLAGYNVENPIGAITAVGSLPGNMATGEYIYKVTYVSWFGESLASATSNTELSGGKITLTNIPVSDNTEIRTKNIYRTAVDSAAPFKYLATINNNVTTYIDTANDSVLGREEPESNFAHSVQSLNGWLGFTKPIVYSTQYVSAAGSNSATATLLEAEYSYCSVPSDLNGVRLPALKEGLIGQKFNIINTSSTNQLSVYPSDPTISVGGQPLGDPLVLSPGASTEIVASSDETWDSAQLSNTLSPALTSIAALTTSGNEMLYTTSTDTYATTPISSAGRSFMSAGSQTSQRSALGVVIGSDVQAFSSVLSSVHSIGSGAANNIIYTTGSGVSNATLSTFARGNLLTATSSSDVRTAASLSYLPSLNTSLTADEVIGAAAAQILTNKTIGTSNILTLGSNTSFQGINFSTAGSTTNGNVLTVTSGTLQLQPPTSGDLFGPSTAADNAIARFDTTTGKLVQNSGVLISDTNEITGVVNITASGNVSAATITGILATAAQTNITSVGTLTSLTAGASTFTGAVNLNAGATIPTGFKLTIADDPVNPNDAANKNYVDAVVSAGAAPLNAAYVATTAVLPNTPTYSSAAGTLTATGAVTSLTIDSVSITASDGRRILVKNQVDPRQNGVFTRTADSSGNWQLTRVTDFDAPSEAVANTSIFVDHGTANINTSWTLQRTVTQFNPSLATPGNSDVTWVQSSGSQTIIAGTGMSQTGNTFNVNGTSGRITALATSLDIDSAYIGQTSITTLGTIGTGAWQATTLSSAYGGTGLASPTSNNVLITAGGGVMSLKSNPSGAFVGTSDTQTITNKIIDDCRVNTNTSVFANTNVTTSTLTINTSGLTAARVLTVPDTTDTIVVSALAQSLTNKTLIDTTNNIAAKSLWNATGVVSTTAATAPTSGQVLTATSSTTAIWQQPSQTYPARVIYVFSGAANVSPNYSTVAAAVSAASALTPTVTNPVLIQVYPGTYSEATPIAIPAFVGITTTIATQMPVVIRPTAPAASSPVFTMSGNARIMGVIINCADGSGGYATIGVHSSGSAGALDYVHSVTVRNASSACFQVDGSGAKNSHILIVKACSAQVTVVGLTIPIGFLVRLGGILSGIDYNISGFFVSGFAGIITTAMQITHDYSIADISSVQITYCTNGIRVGGSTTSNSQSDYPIIKAFGCNTSFISGTSLQMDEKSICRVSDFKVEDNEAFYPNQTHMVINSPALPAEPNLLVGLWTNIREDKIVYGGAGALTNPPTIRGSNLSEVPGDLKNVIIGNLSVGTPINSYALNAGEGASHKTGLMILQDAAGSFTNVTTQGAANITFTSAVNVATTASINLASAPATIDGISPTIGVTRVLVKNGSSVNPGTTSVDNGVYVWNGTGATMTRATDFAAASSRSHNTWFGVDVGTVNYGSVWKINQTTLVNTENVILGTTAFGLLAQSTTLFPALTTNHAMYFGNTDLLQFPGIRIGVTKPITVSSGTSISALIFEYYNGSTWATIPIMTTEAETPYGNQANETFGFSKTVINPAIYYQHIRFGNISSVWATTTINGTLAYWVRCRCTNGAIITRNPIITSVRIHTNHTKVNRDGFIEYFGKARPRHRMQWAINDFVATGTAGETAATARTLIVGTIGIVQTANTFAATGTTTMASSWHPPAAIDTSSPLILRLVFSRSNTAASVGNITFLVNYAFLSANDVVADGGTGTPTTTTRTTGNFTFAVSSTLGGATIRDISLDITGFNSETQVMYFKLSRLANDSLDTYTQTIFLHRASMSYVMWSNGGYYG